MKKNSLGCFSFSALIAFMLTVLISGIFFIDNGSAMFSPGKLSDTANGNLINGVSSHADIGNDCSACHAVPWSGDTMTERCQICHIEIKVELAVDDSLHGILLKYNPQFNCQHCHSEHHGSKALITKMAPEAFPHELLGFSLASHHKKSDGFPFKCADCHTQNVTTFTQDTCNECHQEIEQTFMLSHIAAYGGDCLACHDGYETYNSSFNHAQTDFPLVGEHITTNCSACHQHARNINDFENTPEECSDCHLQDNPHKEQFGTNCGVCHTPQGWTPTDYNHNRTSFPLEGKHRELSCEQCHTTGLAEDTPTACYACHAQDDDHNGQFGEECNICHTSQGWTPSMFSHEQQNSECITCHLTDDHHNGRFGTDCGTCHSTNVWKPSTFKHAQASSDCTTCHLQDDNHNGKFGTSCGTCHSTDAWKPATFKHAQTSSDCVTCHLQDDNHNGKFGTSCGSCHTTNAWTPANVDHSQVSNDCVTCHLKDDNHNGKFGTSCGTCHGTSAWTPAHFSHSQVSSDCSTCHLQDDNHNGKFGTSCNACHTTNAWTPANVDHSQVSSDCATCHSKDDNHNGKFGTSCGTCHSTSAWKPANFSHSQVSSDCATCHLQDDNHNGKFGTSCGTCHSTSAWTPANFNHSQVSSNCSTCHLQDDNHNGNFGTNCGSCHSTNAWTPASFDHSLSNFPLTGAHSRVACEACHTTNTFSGLSTACISCHAEPTFHQGAVGTNCASCHNTSAWVPASYNLSHPVVADEGGRGINHGGASCRTCHPSTVYNYTCLACHSNNHGGDDD